MLAAFLAALESEAERERFAELYERYHGLMEKTALRILDKQEDAEDAVQNAFVKIIRHFGKTREMDGKVLPLWIVCIVKNEARSILRKRKRITQLEDPDGISAAAETVSGYSELVGLFARLPETYRAALEMRFLLDCSGKEIARRLGITESAVYARISRGRALLREIVEKEGYGK